MKISYDHLGIFTSIVCAIHCTVLPLIISSLPFLGIDILESAAIEWGLIAMAFLFGFLSLNHGYRRHHQKKLPALLFCAGFAFLIINQVTDEQILFICIPLAALLIIAAHITNIQRCRQSRKSSARVNGQGKLTIT
ncbi:MerC domain-containing protein [Pseudobacter ginsenosidimutans]|uniref:MerC mercury resistance protein n=1 Tax=Pseudobacter ginsenosidimutans TaxID=661488 RepID=A0A4Q7MZP7_9BACT|nr:MerC domain-containing protein [Pseudobacter ginsenosidimutans]QEC43088.1 MerC domain-containing protein [Pseudobacter ginsenosidimutans]RZS74443.1 MerC mercury resistance protein [Pseudobacter ginsenosidimutans]